MVLTLLGVWRVEGHQEMDQTASPRKVAQKGSFRDAFLEIWNEPQTRRFAIFVFVSMLAYSAQDLILEPFAGIRFGLTPGETTKLSGMQHGGTLIGMALVPLIGALIPKSRGNLAAWTIAGCIASAFALLALAAAALVGPGWPLRETVFMLGVTNGAYAVAAIGSMMALVSSGAGQREGVRMGLWGAAQAVAFGMGGFIGTLASDVARYFLPSPSLSYSLVFSWRSRPVCDRRMYGGVGAVVRGRQAAAQHREIGNLSGCGCCRRYAMNTDTEIFDVVVVGGGPSGATARARSCEPRAQRAAARSRGPHQAVRRCYSATADQRFRYSRSPSGRTRELRAHGVAVRRSGGYAD